MKKTMAMIALAFCGTTAFAQDLTSKKGEPILPEAKDWSIGIDATPFLQYLGNFFGKTTTNNAPTFNFLGSQVITGKYFVDAKTAYRVSLRIGFNNNTQRQTVADRTSTAPVVYPSASPTKENKWSSSATNIGISAGIEKRKGKTRLQGFYGAEAGFFVSGSKDKFTYGNALNAVSSGTDNPIVAVTAADNFSGASNVAPVPTSGVIGQGRIVDRNNGTTFSFGVRGFIGAEYFILPKISIGGEFGWGIGLSTGGKTTTNYESIGNSGGTNPNEVGKTKSVGSRQGLFHFDTDNNNSFFGASGAIRLNFHF